MSDDGARERFVARYGGLFEHSPWVAERTFGRGPFADREQLYRELCATMRSATHDEQLALIRAHPDLAGRLAQQGALTQASTAEQASAGLDRLDPHELERFQRLNAAYREKFDFPFVIWLQETGQPARDGASGFRAFRAGFLPRGKWGARESGRSHVPRCRGGVDRPDVTVAGG